MSRLDYCQYSLLNRDCYDWKNDKCDECNIFKAYCEGARMAKASIVRCKDCKHYIVEGITTQYGWCHEYKHSVDEDDYCSYGERREE